MRQAGSHRRGCGAQRQRAKHALRQEVRRLHPPYP
jgi:hypothetical protein